jgi:ligand-binding sensor domain-containing protein
MKREQGKRKVTALLLASVLTTMFAGVAHAGQSSPSTTELPYVYTDWQQFTTMDGLPNDHIFALAVEGPWVWVGTEDGLARIDKRDGSIRSWLEKDGLPWKVVSALAVNEKTGELWIGLFGGGLARFSGGRFDHFHQLNSGLVNDVVYGVAVENDNVWIATTAGANRYNPTTGEWAIFTEKNAPMEEIWNYAVTYDNGKVYLGVWGSGVLEFDIATESWKVYLDPDGEMEIDLYRDDGIVHVITTGVSYVDQILWVGSYFGGARYDGRHWRGYYTHECGLPNDFINAVKGRSSNEAWYATDKGLGVLTDFATDTWVTYTLVPETHSGKAVISRGTEILETIEMDVNIPHNYVLWTELDGDDVWIGTSKGLAWGKGAGYYPGLKSKTSN